MIAYTTIGVKDMDAAISFYDALLADVGAKRAMVARDGDFVAYSAGEGPMFGLAVPANGEAANPGNGNMVALAVANPDQVQAMYDKAISLGATCEGKPGPRGDGAFSCGYVRDPQGNKLNFFCMGS